MALSQGGGATGISIWNRLGVDRECDKDVRTAAPSVESVQNDKPLSYRSFRPIFNTLVRGERVNP